MTLGVNLSLSDIFYPSNISLKIDNIAVNDTTIANQGLWNRLFYYPYDGDNYESYSVQSNWPLLSFDVSYICTMNKSGSMSSYYTANGTRNYIEWKAEFPWPGSN